MRAEFDDAVTERDVKFRPFFEERTDTACRPKRVRRLSCSTTQVDQGCRTLVLFTPVNHGPGSSNYIAARIHRRWLEHRARLKRAALNRFLEVLISEILINVLTPRDNLPTLCTALYSVVQTASLLVIPATNFSPPPLSFSLSLSLFLRVRSESSRALLVCLAARRTHYCAVSCNSFRCEIYTERLTSVRQVRIVLEGNIHDWQLYALRGRRTTPHCSGNRITMVDNYGRFGSHIYNV